MTMTGARHQDDFGTADLDQDVTLVPEPKNRCSPETSMLSANFSLPRWVGGNRAHDRHCSVAPVNHETELRRKKAKI
jgi:hypothetical protein